MGYKVAVVGATGNVGREMLGILAERAFPADEVVALASRRSQGSEVSFGDRVLKCRSLDDYDFRGTDICLMSAGGEVSKAWSPRIGQLGCVVIDNSSAWRTDPDVPLVVPEVNPEAAKTHKLVIANPNCTTIIALLALYPLHRAVPIRRVVAATYQAASGAGHAAMMELQDSTKAYLDGKPFAPKVLPHPYAFNLFPHNSPMTDSGYCEEEIKMSKESAKIMSDSSVRITATCVRVPVLRTHAEALNIEFSAEMPVEHAYELLRKAPGVTVLEDRAKNRWPMPTDVAGEDDVFVGRVRQDLTLPNTLDVWVVGDQLLKGAALNAVQVAEVAMLGKMAAMSG